MNDCSSDSGYVCQNMVEAWPVSIRAKSANENCSCVKSIKLRELFSMSINCRICEKCQELISGYTKAQDYSEVYPTVIPHYFGCINLDRDFVYLRTCVLILFFVKT